METIAGKILCIFGILVLRLMFGLMPCSLRNPLKRLASSSPTKRKYFAMLVSLLNCFAAGTLLSSCLLHLFPACHAILEGISGEDLSRKKFPLAEMLTAFGLFLLLLIDRGIHCVHRNRCGEFSTRTRSKESISSATTGNTTPMAYSLNRHRINPDDEFDMSDIIAENHIEAVPPKKSSPLRISESPDTFPVEPGLPVEHTEFQFLYVNSPGRKSPCLAIFFVISLSVQSMFTNMALGLQSRDIELWTLFVALALREIVQSFTLGLELDRHTNKRYQSLIGAIGFSVLSALGIVIGTGFESLTFYHESAVTLLGVLLSITNGAILYTVFFDILYHEMLKDYEFPKPIASLIGFGFMTLLIGIVH